MDFFSGIELVSLRSSFSLFPAGKVYGIHQFQKILSFGSQVKFNQNNHILSLPVYHGGWDGDKSNLNNLFYYRKIGGDVREPKTDDDHS